MDLILERLLHCYPGDAVCFEVSLMSLTLINPGDDELMAANEPHDYRGGQCMESMANYDNAKRERERGGDIETEVTSVTFSSLSSSLSCYTQKIPFLKTNKRKQ